MIAAGWRSPQLLRHVRRGHLGPPFARGFAGLFRIFGHVVLTVGPTQRTSSLWMVPAVAALLGMAALLHVGPG